jgi:plasmid stabilization system protein ParE
VRIELHPKVHSDLAAITRHYVKESGQALADRFMAEFYDSAAKLTSNPERFSPYFGHHERRRIKLESFPYVIVFRIILDGIRITIVKHERSHPNRGMRRK